MNTSNEVVNLTYLQDFLQVTIGRQTNAESRPTNMSSKRTMSPHLSVWVIPR